MSETYVTRGVVLGTPLGVMRSYNHWVAKGSRVLDEVRASLLADGSHESAWLALDTRGRVCREREDYERAHKEGTFPVIVYATDGGPEQGEPMTWIVARTADANAWLTMPVETLVRDPSLYETDDLIIVKLFVACTFDEAMHVVERVQATYFRKRDDG